MKVYDKIIDIRTKEDGTYTISIAMNDSSIIVKTITKKDLMSLYMDIDKIIKAG